MSYVTEMAMARQLHAEKKRCKYLIVGKSNGVENLLLKNFQGTCWCFISIESTVFFLFNSYFKFGIATKNENLFNGKKKISKQKVNEIPSRFGSTQRQTVE